MALPPGGEGRSRPQDPAGPRTHPGGSSLPPVLHAVPRTRWFPPPADVSGQRALGEESVALPALRAPDRLVRRAGGRGPRFVPLRRRPWLERAREATRDPGVRAPDAALLRRRHPGALRAPGAARQDRRGRGGGLLPPFHDR